MSKKISFHFHPKDFNNQGHAIEKADTSGKKRRYLCGISSGLNVDAHGERMTEKCIKGFMDQANSGEILLFPDIHGIKESDDIGLLSKAEINPNGDWYTEYKLYDESDGIGPQKAERIDTLWKQVNGLPPYKKPRQKGFSIEGIIPDESILFNSSGTADRGVLDSVDLDGVVLVPRPAYKDSIATAIYKALGETTPYRSESLITSLRESVEQQEVQDKYFRYKWEYQDALEKTIDKIMTKNNTNKREELGIIFNEYRDLMLNLILSSESLFVQGQDDVEEGNIVSPYGIQKDVNSKLELYKSLRTELIKLSKSLEGKNA